MQKGLTFWVSPNIMISSIRFRNSGFCYWAKLISRTMRFIPAYLSKTHIT